MRSWSQKYYKGGNNHYTERREWLKLLTKRCKYRGSSEIKRSGSRLDVRKELFDWKGQQGIFEVWMYWRYHKWRISWRMADMYLPLPAPRTAFLSSAFPPVSKYFCRPDGMLVSSVSCGWFIEGWQLCTTQVILHTECQMSLLGAQKLNWEYTHLM